MTKTVEAAFKELLARQELTPTQKMGAQIRISHLKQFLTNNFQLAQQPFLMGSYARNTPCASERDLDLFVPFSDAAYWGRYRSNSRTFLYWVRDYLNDHYAQSTVSARQVAVVLDFTSFATDVTPGFPLYPGGYVIPNGSGGWLHTNPPLHTSLIKDADSRHQGYLKPLIRLIKAWNIANGHRLRSFHLEMVVERIKRGHFIGTWPAEVATILYYMPSWLEAPFPDPWQPGGNVDDYLSSDERRAIINLLEEDAARAAKAEEYRQCGQVEKAFERWAIVYNHTFPAYS